ncbi:unnamed protein product [Bursaphelenchus xylophilus]|uniref:(pine wood nematode) hypothetical protein n=1 Tax=Bursaphelenchus xylophilus TaxID=6326 RepID=A0A1I7SD37_BURXY|nr:unnamed protein product [Bursaphelenchus xylophilus]CAG9092996.1 unnamed protein product [Bursaphelenchus xylophilus]
MKKFLLIPEAYYHDLKNSSTIDSLSTDLVNKSFKDKMSDSKRNALINQRMMGYLKRHKQMKDAPVKVEINDGSILAKNRDNTVLLDSEGVPKASLNPDDMVNKIVDAFIRKTQKQKAASQNTKYEDELYEDPSQEWESMDLDLNTEETPGTSGLYYTETPKRPFQEMFPPKSPTKTEPANKVAKEPSQEAVKESAEEVTKEPAKKPVKEPFFKKPNTRLSKTVDPATQLLGIVARNPQTFGCLPQGGVMGDNGRQIEGSSYKVILNKLKNNPLAGTKAGEKTLVKRLQKNSETSELIAQIFRLNSPSYIAKRAKARVQSGKGNRKNREHTFKIKNWISI